MFILHWQSASDPDEQTISYGDYIMSVTAEVSKATELVSETWFKLWLTDDTNVAIHMTEKFS